MKNRISAKVNITVEFYDLDPMEIVWHGNYPRYLEKARSELLNIIDYNYKEMKLSGYVWPVVDFRIKYIKPLRLHQKLLVSAVLVEYENRLKIEYVIYDEISDEVLSKAYSIQVAVNILDNALVFVTPQIFQDKVKKVLL